MSKKKKYRPRRNNYAVDATIDFTTQAVTIPVTFGTLGAAGRVSPGAGLAASSVARQASTAYNLMGTGTMARSSLGVIQPLRDLERMTRKKRRR